MENLEDYKGELKALLGFVRYQKDKRALSRFVNENEDIFQAITPETVRAISVLGNIRELGNYLSDDNKEEEEINVCQALQEMIMDGKAEGKAEVLLMLLGELGEVSEALREKVMSQRDFEILDEWIKWAAKAGTVQEFEDRIG